MARFRRGNENTEREGWGIERRIVFLGFFWNCIFFFLDITVYRNQKPCRANKALYSTINSVFDPRLL
jgi:hypothetical protein